jgi:hypothetical protein
MSLFPFLFSLLAKVAPDGSRQDPPRSAHSHSAAPLARPPMRTHSHTCPSASLTPPPRLSAANCISPATMDAAATLPEAWSQVRAPVIVLLLWMAVAVCLTMYVLLFLERVYGCHHHRVAAPPPPPGSAVHYDPILEDDPEVGSTTFPIVLCLDPHVQRVRSTSHIAAPTLFPCLHWCGGAVAELKLAFRQTNL